MDFKASLGRYYQLAKPGIIYGNLLTVLAGFFFASRLHPYLFPLIGVVIGTSCIIGGACAINNVTDYKLDMKMNRTKARGVASGLIRRRSALLFAAIMLFIGFLVLFVLTNRYVVLVGAVGVIDYVILYAVSKRRSSIGTLVGSISGAMPIVAGYVAVAARIDWASIMLFALMVCWQMAHFYAIALYRKEDYASAGIPVLPVIASRRRTQIAIIGYVVGFGLSCVVLGLWHHAGNVIVILGILSTIYWLAVGWAGRQLSAVLWGKKMFLSSLHVLLVISLGLMFGTRLP